MYYTEEINGVLFKENDLKLVEKYRKEVYAWQFAQGIAMFKKSCEKPDQARNYLEFVVWESNKKMNKMLEKMRKQFTLDMYNAAIKQINDEVEMFRNQCCISAEYWKEGKR